MTAATLTRPRRSAFPTTVEELTPLARDYAAELGTTPSRNQLMRRFKVGDKKAKALLVALAPTADVATVPPAVTESPAADLVTAPAALPALPAEPDPVPDMVPDAPVPPAEPAEAEPDPPAQAAIPTVATVKPKASPVTWPVLILCLPAFVAIWGGWVEMGRLTGFGKVTLLPGILDSFQLNTAITLPIGVETYAAYALYVALSGRATGDARRFAKWSAIASLLVGGLGQVAYHLMNAAGWSAAPWPITAVVSCIPVAVLGMGAALAHLMHKH